MRWIVRALAATMIVFGILFVTPVALNLLLRGYYHMIGSTALLCGGLAAILTGSRMMKNTFAVTDGSVAETASEVDEERDNQ